MTPQLWSMISSPAIRGVRAVLDSGHCGGCRLPVWAALGSTLAPDEGSR